MESARKDALVWQGRSCWPTPLPVPQTVAAQRMPPSVVATTADIYHCRRPLFARFPHIVIACPFHPDPVAVCGLARLLLTPLPPLSVIKGNLFLYALVVQNLFFYVHFCFQGEI